MSDVIRPFDLPSAVSFNLKNSVSIGYLGNIPENTFEDFPGLERSPQGTNKERAKFAKATRNYQEKFGLIVDGKFGRQTWIDLLKRYDYVDTGEDYVLFKGRRLAFDAQGLSFKHYSYDERPGGIDLHVGGDFTSWKRLPDRKIKKLLFHWGGVDAKSCKHALLNRDLSSHYGLELGVAFQWIDIAHRTWHAGAGNKDTIGYDLCQQPTVEHLQRYLDLGYDVFEAKNPARRPDGAIVGEKTIITLDTRTAETARELAKIHCELFDIPFVVPRDDDGNISHRIMTPEEFENYSGILWHSHVDPKGWKWDVSPWAQQLFDPGFEYEAV